MFKAVMEWVKSCDNCARCKSEHCASPGLLQPLPSPSQSWKHITMNFIKQLPGSKGKDTILVVVCRFSKYAHFIPLSHPFSATQVAKIFLDSVLKLHGIPRSIVSNRDKIFTSLFWKELFKLLGTSQCYSSAYHS